MTHAAEMGKTYGTIWFVSASYDATPFLVLAHLDISALLASILSAEMSQIFFDYFQLDSTAAEAAIT